jgi:hypothetical protein
MPVIDRHRYTVGWKFGYPTQKRPPEPPPIYLGKRTVDINLLGKRRAHITSGWDSTDHISICWQSAEHIWGFSETAQ